MPLTRARAQLTELIEVQAERERSIHSTQAQSHQLFAIRPRSEQLCPDAVEPGLELVSVMRRIELCSENLQLRPVQRVAEGSLDLPNPRSVERTDALAEQVLGNHVYVVEVHDRRV